MIIKQPVPYVDLIDPGLKRGSDPKLEEKIAKAEAKDEKNDGTKAESDSNEAES